jgi:hypothetical protein
MTNVAFLERPVEAPAPRQKHGLHRLTVRSHARHAVYKADLVSVIADQLEKAYPDVEWPNDLVRIIATEIVLREQRRAGLTSNRVL